MVAVLPLRPRTADATKEPAKAKMRETDACMRRPGPLSAERGLRGAVLASWRRRPSLKSSVLCAAVSLETPYGWLVIILLGVCPLLWMGQRFTRPSAGTALGKQSPVLPVTDAFLDYATHVTAELSLLEQAHGSQRSS